MLINKEWLGEKEACIEGYDWFVSKYADTSVDPEELYNEARKVDKDWGYWLLGQIGGAEFAICCALEVYKEKSFAEWAEKWLSGKDRTSEAAWAAAEAAKAAVRAAGAAEAAWAAWAARAAAETGKEILFKDFIYE